MPQTTTTKESAMSRTYTVTIQITVGDELAEAGTDLIDRRISNALDFDTDQADCDITVDSLVVTAN